MKCPHCSESIGLFSREMNRFGKSKTCPHCQKPVRPYVSLKIAALLFIPAVIIAILLKPVFESFGMNASFAIGIVTGLLVMLAIRLKPAKQ